MWIVGGHLTTDYPQSLSGSREEDDLEKRVIWLAGIALALAACAGAGGVATPTPAPTATPASVISAAPPEGSDAPTAEAAIESPAIPPTPLPGNLDQVVVIEDGQEYYIRQIVQTDGILPIYNPEFTTADRAELMPDELVMGVEINGDARAYSVGVLRSREMVNDEIGGTPVLVTW